MSNAWILIPFLMVPVVGCTKSQGKAENGAETPITAQQTLSKLIVTSDELEPAFDPFVNAYTLAGGETYKNKISINTAPVNAELQITINGVKLRSDFTTDPMPLVAGDNNFKINLVDNAGTIVNSYQLNVQRVKDLPDETLADMATSNGDLAPRFAPEITSYQLDVSAATSVLTLSPLANYPDEASFEINGVSYDADRGGYDVTIAAGTTIITLVVKGRSGRSRTYTIHVTRPAA